MKIHHLFPIPIGMFDLNRELTDKELLFVHDMDIRKNEGNMISNNHFVLRDPAMTSIREWIEDCVSEYFIATVNAKHDVHLRITQSWFNYSEQGQWHHKHAHPNSFVSGVFYINTNSDDKIYFHSSEWKQIRLPPKEWNLYNSESWWFEAKVGRLILFPSSLEHNVPSVQGEDIRISMSFNTFPVGNIGDELHLNGLKISM